MQTEAKPIQFEQRLQTVREKVVHRKTTDAGKTFSSVLNTETVGSSVKTRGSSTLESDKAVDQKRMEEVGEDQQFPDRHSVDASEYNATEPRGTAENDQSWLSEKPDSTGTVADTDHLEAPKNSSAHVLDTQAEVGANGVKQWTRSKASKVLPGNHRQVLAREGSKNDSASFVANASDDSLLRKMHTDSMFNSGGNGTEADFTAVGALTRQTALTGTVGSSKQSTALGAVDSSLRDAWPTEGSAPAFMAKDQRSSLAASGQFRPDIALTRTDILLDLSNSPFVKHVEQAGISSLGGRKSTPKDNAAELDLSTQKGKDFENGIPTRSLDSEQSSTRAKLAGEKIFEKDNALGSRNADNGSSMPNGAYAISGKTQESQTFNQLAKPGQVIPLEGQIYAAIAGQLAGLGRDDVAMVKVLHLRLQPESLGEVSITLKANGKQLTVGFAADESTTVNSLKSVQEDLATSLSELGFEQPHLFFELSSEAASIDLKSEDQPPGKPADGSKFGNGSQAQLTDGQKKGWNGHVASEDEAAGKIDRSRNGISDVRRTGVYL